MDKNDLKQYYSEIDVIRCLGMVLVVIGHSFPDASSTAGIQFQGWKYFFDFIYSFHMPLFFALAGFVTKYNYETHLSRANHIKKRAIRLLVPYFVWAIIYIPFKLVLNKYTSASLELTDIWKILIGNNPYSGLWFLYALFLIDLIQTLVVRSIKIHRIVLIASCIFLVISIVIQIVEPIRWVFYYTFFYMIGYVMKRYYNVIKPFLKNKILFGVCFFTMLLIVYFIQYGSVFYGVSRIITAICGIIVMFGLGLSFGENKIMISIGKYGMDIYIISGAVLVALRIFLYNRFGMNYHIYVLVASIVSFVLPLAISKWIIRKSRLLKLLLLGENSFAKVCNKREEN